MSKSYEVSFEVRITSYNAVTVQILADSEEEACTDAFHRVSRGRWDCISEIDGEIEDVSLDHVECIDEEDEED